MNILGSRIRHWVHVGGICSWVLAANATGLTTPPGLKPDKIHVAERQKTSTWVREGLVTGGDGSVEGVVVRNVKFGKPGQGVERFVIELTAPQKGLLTKAPYYQMAVTPELQQLTLTVFGAPKLQFDDAKLMKTALVKKSQFFDEKMRIQDAIEKDRWNLTLPLKRSAPVAVEVFELSNPLRIVIDVKK
jgi:hypothetical protein